jgi:hypothetical protein
LAASGILRREVLRGGGLLLGALLLPRLRALGEERFALSTQAREALEQSPLVYVSPLRRGGGESRCHGEVWFTFDEGSVLLCTQRSTWKARALEKGLDRARVWVGDFGRGKEVREEFRQGPTFEARARIERDPAAFERLLAAFARKYPQEWGRWEPRFKEGYADGSRVLIRYEPLAG